MSKHTPNSDSQACRSEYSDSAFQAKVKRYAQVAGSTVLEPALKMYYALKDDDTPGWAKSTIIGALGYFILPFDAIPDILPVVGYSDDLTVLAGALMVVSAHIKDEHVEKARATLRQWFG